MEILSASEGDYFDTLLKLVKERGPLDEESWASVRAEHGLERAAALAALVAGYMCTWDS